MVILFHTIPKCKTIAQYSIEDHPEYEATILKFGAVKTKCGKLQPPPKCPCIVKDKCGNYKYKPCPKQKECPVCEPVDKTNKSSCEAKKYQAELIRSKIKLDILMNRYKELLKDRNQNKNEFNKTKKTRNTTRIS